MKSTANRNIGEYRNNKNPHSTHFRKSVTEIHMGFPFTQLPMIESKDVIGFVPMGSWENGWTGIAEYFTSAKLGVCDYSINSMTLTHGAAVIFTEAARYDINKEPDLLGVDGNSSAGFLYHIVWYKDNFSKELECANMNYDPKITAKLVELVKEIDKLPSPKITK